MRDCPTFLHYVMVWPPNVCYMLRGLLPAAGTYSSTAAQTGGQEGQGAEEWGCAEGRTDSWGRQLAGFISLLSYILHQLLWPGWQHAYGNMAKQSVA